MVGFAPGVAAARLAGGVLAAAVVVGCAGGGGPADEREEAERPPGGGTQAGSDAVEPASEASVRGFYEEFVYVSDTHRVPDDDVARGGSGLETLAAPAVVAYFDAWRAEDEANEGDGPLRRVRFSSSTNVESVTLDGATATVRDCTLEVRELTGGHVIEAYVTRVVTIVDESGEYRVTDLDVEHEGELDSPGYGCLPGAMAAEAAEVARAAAEGFTAAQADPGAGLPAAVDKVVTDPLQQEMASSLAEQASRRFAMASAAEVTVRPLGLDPRGLGRVAVVAVCIAYPDGLELRDLSTREPVRQLFPPGTVNKLDYAVRLDHAEGPAAYAVVREERSRSC